MPIDPLFGIELSASELTNNIPMSPIYGVTPNNTFIPIRIDTAGRLELAAGVSLEVSDLQIGAVEVKNATTDDRMTVTPTGEAVTEARVHDEAGTGITSTLISTKQGLDVNVVGGSALSVSEDEDGDVPANQSSVGLLINLNYGYDGVSWKRIHSTSNAMHVDVQSSVLPTGAATEATLSSIDSKDFATETTLSSLNSKDFATETTLSSIDTNIDVLLSTRATEATLGTRATEATLGGFRTDFNAVDFATEATLAGFRSDFGAVDFATETTQTTLLTQSGFDARINTLGQKVSASSTPVVIASDQSTLTIGGSVSVSNFPATQTVAFSQTGTDNDVDANITNASLPVDLRDGSGNTISSTGNALDVNIASGVTLEVNLDNANDNVLVYGFDGAVNRAILTDSDGHLQIDVLSSALPTGAATEATLSTLNGKVTAVDTDNVTVVSSALPTGAATEATLGNVLTTTDFQARINTLGQKTSANSTPVVLASDQSTLTTDLTDDETREVGRVSSNHTIHTEESYATTNTDANARPTNGDFNLQHHKTKTVAIRNTGANNARVNVLGSVDGGTNFDIVIANNTAVNAGNVLIVDEERAMTHLRVEARSAVADNSTTIVTRGYSLGT